MQNTTSSLMAEAATSTPRVPASPAADAKPASPAAATATPRTAAQTTASPPAATPRTSAQSNAAAPAAASTAAAAASPVHAAAPPVEAASGELETLRQRCRTLEAQVAESAQSNAAFVSSMQSADTKQVVMYEEQLMKLRDELTTSQRQAQEQREAHEREMGVLKAQLEHEIQAKGGDHTSKLNASRAVAAEAKVSQLQNQLLSLQAAHDELVGFKKSTEFGIRESPAFATEVGKFFAEMDSLRNQLQSEKEAREAALAAWEAAEARAHRLLEQQSDQKTELHRDLKIAMEEKRVLEKNVEWQMEQNRRDEGRLRMVEAELRQRTEEATSMRIKLAGFQTEVRAAMEMEQIKAQVMIESLKTEIEHREHTLQRQIDTLQHNLDRESMQKLQLEKALKKSELTFQDQLRERERYWREQQLQVQQQQQRVQLELPLPADIGGVGAKVRSARQREIQEIDERIAALQHEHQEHEARKVTRAQQHTEGEEAAARHPLTSKLAQLGNDLFKRSVFSMPGSRGGGSRGDPWSMQPPPQYQQQQQPQPQYQSVPPPQQQQRYAPPPQQQYMTPAPTKQKSPSVRNLPRGSDAALHDDHAFEQEFWASDPAAVASPPPGAHSFMSSPQPVQRGAPAAKNTSHPTSAKPPHFVAPIAGAAGPVPPTKPRAGGVSAPPSGGVAAGKSRATSGAGAKPPPGPPNAGQAARGSRQTSGRK